MIEKIKIFVVFLTIVAILTFLFLIRNYKKEDSDSKIIKSGVLKDVLVDCKVGNPATITVVATYFGAKATPDDITLKIEDKTNNQIISVDNPSIYKGSNCNIYSVGGVDCNQQVSSTNPINNGELVGIKIFQGNFNSGASILVSIIVFGRTAAIGQATCY